MTTMWDGWPDAVLLGMASSALLIGFWAVLDTRSWAAVWVSWAARGVGGRLRLALALGAILVFLAIAEDVVRAADTEWVYRLDRQVEGIGHVAKHNPTIKIVAEGISFITGMGLSALLIVAAGILLRAGRRTATGLLIVGTVGAWGLALGLKALFHVARPGTRPAVATSYGFPSGHALVTLVVAGLLCWIYSRGWSGAAQWALYAGALVAAIMAGGARIVLHAHWLSDIVASLALGICYLVAVLRAAERLSLLRSESSSG